MDEPILDKIGRKKGGPKKGTHVDVTPRPNEREKAFEIFLNAGKDGKVRSVRSVAQELGVHEATISRWRKIDGWDDKIQILIAQAAQAADTLTKAIKRRVRRGVLDGLDELAKIIKKSDKDADRIAAVKAMVEIGLKIDALAQAGSGMEASGTLPEFKDDLDELGKEPECPDIPIVQDLNSTEKSTTLAPSIVPQVQGDLT